MINKKVKITIYFLIIFAILCVMLGFNNYSYAQTNDTTQYYKVWFVKMEPLDHIFNPPVFDTTIELNGDSFEVNEKRIVENPEIYIKMVHYDDMGILQYSGEITKQITSKPHYNIITLRNIKLNPEYRPDDNFDLSYRFWIYCEKTNRTPTPTKTPTPTIEPTVTPTIEPTVTPTIEPTETPTIEPTGTSTIESTVTPTIEPTVTPTITPVVTESPTPIITPTDTPINNIVASSTLPQTGENDNYFKIIFSLFIIFIGFIVFLLAKHVDI